MPRRTKETKEKPGLAAKPHPPAQANAAGAALFTSYRKKIVKRAALLVPNHAAAEDVAQEVGKRLLKCRTVPQKPWPYINKAIQSCAYDFLRKLNRQRELERNHHTPSSACSDPWEDIEREEESRHILGALGTLSTMNATIISDYYFGRKSLVEIAKALGLSEKAVSRRHRRSLLKLAEDKGLQKYLNL